MKQTAILRSAWSASEDKSSHSETRHLLWNEHQLKQHLKWVENSIRSRLNAKAHHKWWELNVLLHIAGTENSIKRALKEEIRKEKRRWDYDEYFKENPVDTQYLIELVSDDVKAGRWHGFSEESSKEVSFRAWELFIRLFDECKNKKLKGTTDILLYFDTLEMLVNSYVNVSGIMWRDIMTYWWITDEMVSSAKALIGVYRTHLDVYIRNLVINHFWSWESFTSIEDFLLSVRKEAEWER